MKYSHSLDSTFAALADPTRRRVLMSLMEGERTVGELAEPFDISPSGFSKHLRVLEAAGLLTQTKLGRRRYCRLNPAPMVEAVDWLARHRRLWTQTLRSFGEYIADLQDGDGQ